MKQRFHVFWIAGSFFLCFLATLNRVQAQSIQIDGTTPTTPGICTGSCIIEGGLQHGSNLFHSFSQFNVDSGSTVRFLDPGVTNILSRVTGTNRSDILGTLGVSGGNANLFLINPNGIIFGANASLDVRGSFVGTTANAISFGNQGSFNASADNVSPLLTVNPSALLFNQSANRGIENNSIAPARLATSPFGLDALGLRVPDGQTLLLVGGNVTLNKGRLNAFGGRVEMGGLAESGEIGLDANGNNLSLNFPDGIKRTDVSLTNGARIDVTAGSGGSTTINAQNLEISGQSELRAGIETGLGSVDSQAGEITLNATEAVTVGERSRVNNRVLPGATGNGGNINITAKKLSLSNGSDLSANTFGKGNAGSIFVQASDIVSLESGSRILSSVARGSIGSGGNISITARELSLRDGRTQLSTSTFGEGNAGSIFVQASDIVSLESGSRILSNVESKAVGNGGNISITARELSLRDGRTELALRNGRTELGANTFGEGNAGSVFVQVSDVVSLESDSLIDSTVAEGAIGDGGEVNIRARSLSLTGGAQLAASVFREANNLPGGRGKGGSIIVNASDSVNLSGSSEITEFSSGLFTATEGGAEGQAGSITVNTDALTIADGAIVNAQTLNQSNGGNITINATTFDAVNGGQIITTASSSGNAGNVTLKVTDRTTLSGSDPTFDSRSTKFGNRVQNEGSASGVFASTRPNSSGQGGDINISTGQLLIQDGAEVNVSSEGTGNAGDLEVTSDSIELNNRGKLTATSESGEGGDIRLQDLDLLLLRDNSEISTTAGSATGGTGNGGNITINTDVLVGLENSDITANAFEGEGGFIQITAQGIFGLEVNETDTINELRSNNTSDISAASQKDPSLNGKVEINRPEAEPSSGLVNLPAELVDISELIAQGCAAGRGNVARAGKFVATGRGGLPPTPTEALRSDAVLADLGTPVQSQARPSAASPNLTNSQPTPIVEAQGWVIGSKGEVVLTAQAPTVTRIPWLTPTSCNAS